MISHFAHCAADFSRPPLNPVPKAFRGISPGRFAPNRRPNYSGDSSGLGEGGVDGEAGEVIAGGTVEVVSPRVWRW